MSVADHRNEVGHSMAADRAGRPALNLVTLAGGRPDQADRVPEPGSGGVRKAQFHGQTLGEAFVNAAVGRPDHPAVVTADGAWSHRRLLDAAIEISRVLVDRAGVSPGDRVAILLPNGPFFPAAYYGVLLAGGVVVPLSPDTECARLTRIMRDCEVRAAIVADGPPGERRDLGRVAARVDLDETGSVESASLDMHAPAPPAPPAPRDLAMILFTSGSTGHPKGVMLSHANVLANARCICTHLPVGPDERALAGSPFCHAFGNAVMQTHLLCGATLVIDGSLTFPTTIIEAIKYHGATSFSAVPEAWRFLMSCGAIRPGSLPSLRYATTAGAPMPQALAMEISRAIAPAEFFCLYGQTESTSRLSFIALEDLAHRPGSIGRGAPGLELKVVNDRGERPRQGEVGEILARGPNVMGGYWRDEQTTARVLRDGWLHTGDLAVADADGFIYLRGRVDDIVKINGFRLHPAEIEQIVTSRLPEADVAAVAFDHGDLGLRLALFLRLRNGLSKLTEPVVRDLCRRDLPRHMTPCVIQIVDDFPLTGTMKLDRAALARHAANLAQASVTIP